MRPPCDSTMSRDTDEPEPRAGDPARRGVSAEELREDLGLLRGRNADPLVLHLDANSAVRGLGR